MKIPKARKLSSGAWFIQLRLGGRSVSVTEPTEQACIKKATRIKAEYMEGRDISASMDRSARTLDKLLEQYISAKRPVLSPSTVRGYEAIRRTRFLAYSGRDPEKIIWQRMVSDESRLCGAKTLRNAWALVAAAVQYSGASKPTVTLPQIVSDEHPYLEADQIPVFLDAVRDRPCELAALLGLHGLRRSEMFALTWEDIDLTGKTIRVRAALVHDETGKLIRKKETKNRSSRRTVPIMIPRLFELLQNSEKKTGQILSGHPNSVYKQINTVCANAGLPLIGVHGLRHSFASLAHSLGVPEQECMALGGWQDPQTMRRIYTHLDANAKRNASNAISAFYQNANAKC